MLMDLVLAFPELREDIELAQKVWGDRNKDDANILSQYIYPPFEFDNDAKEKQQAELKQTHIAQPAIGALSIGVYEILKDFGVYGEMAGGHSFGELTALCAASCYSKEELFYLASIRGQLMAKASPLKGAMSAISASHEKVSDIITKTKADIVIANDNSPKQVVISGKEEEIEKFESHLKENKIRFTRLNVHTAFHSPLVAAGAAPFAKEMESFEFKETKFPVYSNTIAAPYPLEAGEKRQLLASQIGKSVKFVDQIKKMHRDGATHFIEIGPSSILTKLVKAILKDEMESDKTPSVKTYSLDQGQGKRNGVCDLAHLLGQLAVNGMKVKLEKWDENFVPKIQEKESSHSYTVPICGANVFTKKEIITPKKEKKAQFPTRKEDKPQPIPVKTTSKATSKPLKETIQNQHHSIPNVKTKRHEIMEKNVGDNRDITRNHSQVRQKGAIKGSGPSDYLSLMQENLLALQKLQQENAKLHRFYLESHSSSQQLFFRLLEQQQNMIAGEPLSTQGYTAPIARSEEIDTYQYKEEPRYSYPAEEQSNELPSFEASPVETVPERPQAPVVPELSYEAPQERVIPQPPKREEVVSKATQTATTDNKQIETALLDVISEKTGYPSEMLNLEMTLEGDLGIDSIKRVEIFSTLSEKLPEGIEEISSESASQFQTLKEVIDFLAKGEGVSKSDSSTPTTAKNTSSSTESVNSHDIDKNLIDVISEKTGFPAEMITMDMDFESDLGIDSIKRVEIFSSVQEKIPGVNISSESTADLRSIGDVAKYIKSSFNEHSAGDTPPIAEASGNFPDPATLTSPSTSAPSFEGMEKGAESIRM